MGTNFYARILPTESQINELKDLIDKKYFQTLLQQVEYLSGESDEYTLRNVIHLGKRSGGWKFLWNPNVRDDWNLKEGRHVYKFLYPLTRKGISEFLSRPDIIITSEYYTDGDKSEMLTTEEFLDMAFNWYPDGYDLKKYEESDNGHDLYPDSRGKAKAREWGFDSYKGLEFYSDGLRFSTTLTFS